MQDASLAGGNVGILPLFAGCSNLDLSARPGTVSGGQFDWGGRLPKSNGGAPRFVQHGWKSCAECIGINELDCEAYKPSRDESRTK